MAGFLYLSKETMALTLSSLEKQHQFLYSKDLVFPDPLFEKKVREAIASVPIPASALHYGLLYQNSLEQLTEASSEVRFINQHVGYGLFNLEFLEKGAFIGSYTGLVDTHFSYEKLRHYLYSYPRLQGFQTSLSIDAEHHGNLTRFINHSISPNLENVYAYHKGLYYLILIANQPIKKETQLCYNYGAPYWYLRGSPNAL